MAQVGPIQEEVRPFHYDIRVLPNPLHPDDPDRKVLVVVLPSEQRSYFFELSEDQKARLHDGTAPTSGLATL